MIFRVFRRFITTSFTPFRWRIVLGLVATTLFLLLLLTNDEIRLISAVLFCLLVPGFGWARRLPGNSRGDTLALAVILSICATILLGTVMALLDAWSPVMAFLILTLIGVLGFLPLRPPQPACSHQDEAERPDS